MTTIPTPRNSKASLAAAIVIGLTLFKGVALLIQAAAVPLETLAVRVINALLMRGWRNVMPLDASHYPMALLGYTAVEGLALVAIGLAVGMKLVPRSPQD